MPPGPLYIFRKLCLFSKLLWCCCYADAPAFSVLNRLLESLNFSLGWNDKTVCGPVSHAHLWKEWKIGLARHWPKEWHGLGSKS